MLVELMIAGCVYIDRSDNKAVCHYHHSEWWHKTTIVSIYKDKTNHYVNSDNLCWIKHDNKNRTLVTESCSDFQKRLNND